MDITHWMRTFDVIYSLLLRFSDKIQSIQEISYRITKQLGQQAPDAWNNFIRHFNKGTYYNYRCQGYVESLRLTGAYSDYAVNVWVNQLVYPDAEHFIQAMNDLKELLNNTQNFQLLLKNLSEFQQIAIIILQYANRLNTIGPSLQAR